MAYKNYTFDPDMKLEIEKGPFEPNMDSLRTYVCPDWFRDAKFGIWSHWGPQSVPMYGDWYARNMYIQGSDQYKYHCRHYGHPSKFGYKDICKLWKAEKFDPDELMDLYVRAGARYFVGQAMHHDNFDNFDSDYNDWNSTKVGPMKDICQLWKAAAKKRGLPFGVTEHLAASYVWMHHSHLADEHGYMKGVPYDGADPENSDLYRDNDSERDGWYTVNEKYHQDWYRRIKNVIDKLEPDLLYSDGGLPFGKYGEAIVAHLYNKSAARNGGVNQAVYNQKDTNPDVFKIGVLDIERGIRGEAEPFPWQDDTSLGDWFYNVRDNYKTSEDVIDTLVDIVSKNGNLLMNVTQKPDGTIDDETRASLIRIGDWIAVNGEGIYGTRPWIKATEGRTSLKAGAFAEGKAEWTEHDWRFTQGRDGTVYAFRMRSSANTARIASLGSIYTHKNAKAVSVLGVGPVNFTQREGDMLVDMPENKFPTMPACVKIEY